ncbi:helix-turn-helix domain-containing protein [Alteribacillus sp. JSM 102045]|uniref:helix-turn-helix domain-containing protein n=1 Tax=Alteribacillus sp. JSM 102045 TaxID=1562101 RepID=UPI0035C1FEBB
MIKKYIGSKVKEYRKAINLTTADLGERSETSQSTISEIERGSRAIQIETLINICDSLGVTLSDVLPPDILKEQMKENDNPRKKQLISLVNRLSDKEIELLTNMLIKVNKLSSQERETLTRLIYSMIYD